jgi:hypothetical protein
MLEKIHDWQPNASYMLEYERCLLVLPLTIPLSPNHRPKPPSEHLNLDRESFRKQTLG